MNSTPYVNESSHLHRVTGFGDTILATLLSPSYWEPDPASFFQRRAIRGSARTSGKSGLRVCLAIWVTNGWREYFRNSGFQLVARVRRR